MERNKLKSLGTFCACLVVSLSFAVDGFPYAVQDGTGDNLVITNISLVNNSQEIWSNQTESISDTHTVTGSRCIHRGKRHTRVKKSTKAIKRPADELPSCPLHENLSSFETRSFSPWNYTLDFQWNRYPQLLSSANCLCRYCYERNSIGELEVLPLAHSKIITVEIWVRVAINESYTVPECEACQNCTVSYQTLNVNAGCHCIRD